MRVEDDAEGQLVLIELIDIRVVDDIEGSVLVREANHASQEERDDCRPNQATSVPAKVVSFEARSELRGEQPAEAGLYLLHVYVVLVVNHTTFLIFSSLLIDSEGSSFKCRLFHVTDLVKDVFETGSTDAVRLNVKVLSISVKLSKDLVKVHSNTSRYSVNQGSIILDLNVQLTSTSAFLRCRSLTRELN